ncbi:MAG: hypothetical protein ACP5I8_15790 [Phycisphaerae bacterium]
MRVPWLIIAISTAIAVGNPGVVPCADSSPAYQASTLLVKKLAGQGVEAGQKSLGRLLRRRRLFAGILVSGVKSPGATGCAAAMYLLGVYRVAEGVPILLANINFRYLPPKSSRIVIGPPGPHPAVWALDQIGMPSVRAILKTLPREAIAQKRQLMIRVMVGVEGSAVASFRVRRLLAAAKTGKQKANLAAALADIPAATH